MIHRKIGVRLAVERVEYSTERRTPSSVGDYLRHLWTVSRVLEAMSAHYKASKG